MPDDHPPIAAAVIPHNGRVLLIRRRVAEGTLLWQLPAGKAAPGEPPAAAAAREVLEEAGVTVEAVRLLGERVHPDTRRSMAYWACRLVAGTAHVASPREVGGMWATRTDLRRLIPGGLFDPVQAYLEEVLPP
ncbi:NUDIX hydrolase [Streptomyces sp. NPDC050564]|uniref:NUDIX hydrolase n=1 Tax=Streptomyces sp. NPDC050564 TaxID=3365631 RepID=UPI0037A909D7